MNDKFMKEPIVKVEHLSHRYSIQWAVRDISFEIPVRGIYGLLGSNGAGKSTTMNIISGVIKQTEGQVFIKGIDARKRPVDAKRHIGFLPQKPPLYGDLTVEEYLIHCARLRWVADKDIIPAVDEVLAKCGITHFRKRLIKNLSGGYQQRVGIAQAIVHKPDLVIFDEPTNGLDPNQIMEIRHLIRDIAKDRTVILSTHILTEVQAVCEKGSFTIKDYGLYYAPAENENEKTLLVRDRRLPGSKTYYGASHVELIRGFYETLAGHEDTCVSIQEDKVISLIEAIRRSSLEGRTILWKEMEEQ